MQQMRLVFLALLVMSPFAANADLILDRSPGTYDTAVLQPTDDGNWTNIRSGQHFADSFSFGSNMSVTGMDIYSGTFWGAVGDIVSVQLWADNGGAPGALLFELIEEIALIDLDGARGNTDRKHVDLTNPLDLLAGTTYWIGMSGALDLTQLGLGNPGAPQDGGMAQFNGDNFVGFRQSIGDMAFRLHGAEVPEPGTLALLGLGLVGLAARRRRKV